MFFISLLLSCILISSNITSNKMVMEKYKIIKTKALYHKEKLIEQLRKMRFYFPFPVPVYMERNDNEIPALLLLA